MKFVQRFCFFARDSTIRPAFGGGSWMEARSVRFWNSAGAAFCKIRILWGGALGIGVRRVEALNVAVPLRFALEAFASRLCS